MRRLTMAVDHCVNQITIATDASVACGFIITDITDFHGVCCT